MFHQKNPHGSKANAQLQEASNRAAEARSKEGLAH